MKQDRTTTSRTSGAKHRVKRPTFRRFTPRFEREAAAFVRRGGAAVIDGGASEVRLLLPQEQGRLSDLARWALYAIGLPGARAVGRGVLAGCRQARVPVDYEGTVLDWCARDAGHPRAVRTLWLDCLACAACCHDANVVLGQRDIARLERNGHGRLVSTGRDGVRRLRMASSGRCAHLGTDRRCAIYAIRPNSCRAFLVGSEACLAAREQTLGLRDGLA